MQCNNQKEHRDGDRHHSAYSSLLPAALLVFGLTRWSRVHVIEDLYLGSLVPAMAIPASASAVP